MASEIETLLAGLYHPGLKTIDPGLDRVAVFLKLIGSPHKRLPPVIHVAGTNGKGSLIAFLHAIFNAAGYRVHRYISPHLVNFNERIVIDSKPISDDYLLHLLKTVRGYVEKQPVTFFEATTAAAFLAFSEHPADVVLLETGMGGRLDATNVIDQPLLTAITPIGFDHCDFLGTALQAIAREKAGIIKRGVACVVGRQEAEAAQVIAHQAQILSSPVYRMNDEWKIANQIYKSKHKTTAIRSALAGAHQIDNAATAVACIDTLQGFSISDTHIEQGLQQAVWPARLQPLTSGYYARLLPENLALWLDGGHNPHGAKALADWFATQRPTPIYVICGMVKGKDTTSFLRILAPYITQLYAIEIPEESLSQPVSDIENAAHTAGISAQSADSIENALQSIAAHAKTPAIVCICGSLYLAGKVLAKNEG